MTYFMLSTSKQVILHPLTTSILVHSFLLTLKLLYYEARNIATDLNIQDRVERMAEQQAFITLKDHKDNFENNPPADSSTQQKVR